MVEQGVVEVTLLGQNVNAYGAPSAPPAASAFAELLHELGRSRACAASATPPRHPQDMKEDVVRPRRRWDGVCPHMHLPLQAGLGGSSRRCAGPTTGALHGPRGAASASTTPTLAPDHRHHRRVPGETEADFEETLEVVRGGRVRRRVHLHLLAAARDRGRRDGGRLRRPRGVGGPDGAARPGRPAARERARPALRRPHARRPGGGRVRAPTRAKPARAHRPQQGRQLRRAWRSRARSCRWRSPPPRRRRWPARCRCWRAPRLGPGKFGRRRRTERRRRRHRGRSTRTPARTESPSTLLAAACPDTRTRGKPRPAAGSAGSRPRARRARAPRP